MKRRSISMMLVLCLLFSMIPATALAANAPTSGSCGGNVKWSLSSSGVLRIYGKGNMQGYSNSVGYTTAPWNLSSGAVKSIVIESGVTSIGSAAFSGLSNVTSVTIPASVTRIGDYAFEKCYPMQGIKLPEKLTYLGKYAFRETSITDVTLPVGITTVYAGTFYKCTDLISVTFNGDLKDIGESAFFGCSLLENVTFKGSFAGQIEEAAFAYCDSLKRFDVPEGTKIINERAFTGCVSLAEVTLPEGIESIWGSAFFETALKDVTIPSTVNYMVSPFGHSLESLTMHSSTLANLKNGIGTQNLSYVHVIGDAPDVTGAVLGSKKEYFVVYYDEGAAGWTQPTWNGYVTEVWGSDTIRKSGTCGENDNLTWKLEYGTLTISGTGRMKNYTAGINNAPWYPCWHWIDRIVIEDGVTSIGNYAFYGLKNAADVTIPSGMKEIGNDAFSGCEGLTEVDIPEGVTTIGNNMFYGCIGLSKATIPDTVTSLGWDTFEGCRSLTSVKLPKNLSTIPIGTFHGTKLAEIDLPKGIVSIENHAFYSCFQLKTIEIPSTVTKLDGFKNCGLTEITIPTSVTTIATTAFYDCMDLKTIYFVGDAPVINWGAFGNVTATVYYPEGNETWTEAVMQNYGGTLTWTPYHVHAYAPVITAPTCTEDGYTTYTCTCGDSYVSDEIPTTGHAFTNGVCGNCGAADPNYVVPTQKFKIELAQLNLGNELTLYFLFPVDSCADWTGCYAEITKPYADGTPATTVTVPVEDWEDEIYSGDTELYRVAFNGVAAKEMADDVNIVIYNAKGEAISEVGTESIRSYLMRMLEKRTDIESLRLAVDMLNYGAAAQQYFDYNTGDLANSLLTEEQKTYGTTGNAACENNQVKGSNAYGTSLELGSNIRMKVYFTGMTRDMTATVTFRSHAANIPATYDLKNQGNHFLLDQIVVADGRQELLITVYNADGSVYGTMTDSIESYVARGGDRDALFQAILKFSDAAYAYLHK